MEEGGVIVYKVLLVDDEPFAIEGLKLMVDWEKHGFRIDAVCENGDEAIRRIRKDPPDLVVTDIRMPVLDGLELIQETRRLGNESIKFVITSGYDDFDYAIRAIRLGVSHYLTKPIISSEADDVLVQLQKELRERDRRKLIRDKAGFYAVRHALSILLFGGEEAERGEALLTLSHLTGKASGWTYLHVKTEAEGSGKAREAAQRLADESACCYLVDCDRSVFGLVLASDESNEYGEAGGAGIRAFAERLLLALQNAACGRIGIGVGSTVDRLDQLFRSYSSAVEAEPFLFLGGGRACIVHYADIRGKTLSFDPKALKAADTIVEAMENGNPDTLTAAVREAFLTFEANMTQPELVGIFTTQVALRCASIYKELGGDPDELLKESYPVMSVLHVAHLWETADMLTGFCLKCQSAASALQESQTGGTQAKVADFLRRNFTETFTIKELAERFYINPVYLGQSFSRKYGVGVLDFIHDLRIEEAKRLLKETNSASHAIAESLGYRGYQYFLKQFEKRIGMKPAEYRLSFRK
jgi:two-component system response regulator YesN